MHFLVLILSSIISIAVSKKQYNELCNGTTCLPSFFQEKLNVPDKTYLKGTKVGGFPKQHHIFGLNLGHHNVFPPNYFSHIFFDHDFVDLL